MNSFGWIKKVPFATLYEQWLKYAFWIVLGRDSLLSLVGGTTVTPGKPQLISALAVHQSQLPQGPIPWHLRTHQKPWPPHRSPLQSAKWFVTYCLISVSWKPRGMEIVLVRCSLTKPCLTFCDSMDCSTPGFSVLHRLLELTQTHVHGVGDAIQPSHPLSSPSTALNLSQHQSLSTSRLFTSGGQSTEASASVSIFLMNIHGWSSLGLTSLISLQSKGFSRVFSSTIIWRHQFFGTQSSIWSCSHIHTWLLEKL